MSQASAAGELGANLAGLAAAKLASWLALAAAPTFALMAALTCLPDQAAMPMLCSTRYLGGMVPMYALMTAFHLAPWLRLASWRRGRRGELGDRSADQSGDPTRSYPRGPHQRAR